MFLNQADVNNEQYTPIYILLSSSFLSDMNYMKIVLLCAKESLQQI